MSDIAGRRRRNHEEEGESYFISMSDLMAGVLFLFIIMLTNFALMVKSAPPPNSPEKARAEQKARAQAERLKLEQAKQDAPTKQAGPVLAPPPDARTATLLAMSDYLKSRNVPVSVDLGAGALRFQNSALFEGGGTALSGSGRAAMAALAQAMKTYVPCFTSGGAGPAPPPCPRGEGRIGAVFLEGHTDTGSPADWGTSVSQGAAAFQSVVGADPSLQGLRSATGQSLMSVSGYGPSRPVTPGDRGANSRLDVRFVLAAG